MDKAPDAYRTISEVGEDLDIAQHVLRFWETRFPQIKPLKRGGGRRYYRPDDVELLKGIRHLLYREGYTIKGVQRILREQGPRGVQAVGKLGSLAALGGAVAPVLPDDESEQDTNLRIEPRTAASTLSQPPMTTSIEHAATWLARSDSGSAREANFSAPVQAAADFTPLEPAQEAFAPDMPPALALPSRAPQSAPAAMRESAPAMPGQVAMYRGGLQRAEAPVAPADTGMSARAAAPIESIDRRARLRFALGELEACQSVIAEVLRRGR